MLRRIDSFSGKADRADIYLDGSLVWTKANPTTPEREQADRTEVERMLAKPLTTREFECGEFASAWN